MESRVSASIFLCPHCIPPLSNPLASGDKFNVSGRTTNGRFVALSIDSPGSDGNYGAHRLQITGNYLGPAGSKAIDPNGFDVEILPNNRLRFWMTNLRPPVDAVSGEFLDATNIGANATVESFELVRGENELKWTGTFGANDGVLHSTNKAAADLNGGFVVSNDHSVPSKLWSPFPRNNSQIVRAANNVPQVVWYETPEHEDKLICFGI